MSKENVLVMERFNGTEEYEVEEATWNLYEEVGKMDLCIHLESEKALRINEDVKDDFQMLNWELNLIQKKLGDKDLIPGFKASIPDSYLEKSEEYVTNFYYFEHDGSENNTIEVLDRKKDKLLLKLSGEIVDVNHYDGSQAPSKLSLTAWFSHDDDTTRSIG